MERLFLIDGNSLAFRAFYAMPYLVNSNNEPSGAVYGFANLLIKLIVDEKPDDIVVAFDFARRTFRNNVFEQYKGTRSETPAELISQFPIIRKMLDIMNIKVFQMQDIEADDILGTLATKLDGVKKIIISGDRDLLQLVDDNTEVWLTKKGLTEIQKVTSENIYSIFGFNATQVPDVKALMGDTSDNIPGVSGIGEKTAIKLIQEYGSIDNLYKNITEIKGKLQEKLLNGKENAYMSLFLATIKTDCEVEYNVGKISFPFSKDVYKFFLDWSFGSLLKRNDLFNEIEIKENKISVRRKIQNIDDLKCFRKKINKYFCYSFEKLEFTSCDCDIFYLDKEISMFNDIVSLDDVIQELKDVFEDKNIIKITNSAKKDMHLLKNYNIVLNNFFDISIARYLIFSGMAEPINDINIDKMYNDYVQLSNELEKNNLENLYYNCELPLVPVLFGMEEQGFKIDEDVLKKLEVDFKSELNLIKEEIYILADEEFNINSPKQVGQILFEKLKLTSYNNKKNSTSSDYLMEMVNQHPIVEKILLYRKLNKLITTYVDVYIKICEKSGDIIHTVFNQTLTNTGRLSSSDPNLQNIPARDDIGKNIRKIFISSFKDGKIISADYNQIELRLMADLSGEDELIDAYKRGEDIHRITASQIFKIPLKDVTDAQRRSAKAVNFGIIYGISDYGLSQNIQTSRKSAKAYIDTYFEKYKKVKDFSENNIQFAREHGYICTVYGRKRNIPEINATNFRVRTFAERVAMNMPLQGTASDIIKFAMINVFDKLKNMKSKLVLQIHDELIIDTFPGEELRVKEILKESMENIYNSKVKLLVTINEGNNLYDCK